MKNKVKTISIIFLIIISTINIITIIGGSVTVNKSVINAVAYKENTPIIMKDYFIRNPILNYFLKAYNHNYRYNIHDLVKKDDRDPETDDPDQQQTQYERGGQISGNMWGAQSFKPTLNVLTKVELYVKRSVSIRSNLIVSIREDLQGNDLTRIEKRSETIPTEMQWVEFDFTDIHTEPEETYYIVVHTEGISSRRDFYQWGGARNTNYERGISHISSDAGRNWLDQNDIDACFKTYGDEENNNPPVAVPDFAEIFEGETAIIDVLENDYDPDNDTIKLVKVGKAKNGTVNRTASSNLVSYKPDDNFIGNDTFTYLITDGNEVSEREIKSESIGRVNITVKRNELIARNDSATVEEDSKNNNINVLANDQGINIIIINITEPEYGNANIVGDNISYTPEENYFGNDSFEYTIRQETSEEPDTATVNVIITPINDPPKKPDTPSGENNGRTEIPYQYITITSDPENNDIRYGWDWNGDDTVDEWTEFQNSETECQTTHTWETAGTFNIKVKAEDKDGLQSEFSNALTVTIIDNTQPNKPNDINGPNSGKTGEDYSYKTSATDPDGDYLKYGWDFDGDDTVDVWTENYIKSGDEISISHTWTAPGTFNIKVKAEDDRGGLQSEFSNVLTFTIIDNTQPAQISIIDGPISGLIGTSYTFSTSTTDPDNDKIYYKFDWDDGTTSEWTKPYNSGEIVEASHTFEKTGTYNIRVKSKDEKNEESDWSEVFPIKISEPDLQITITKESKLFNSKITATVKNNGETAVSNLNFDLYIEYGFLKEPKEEEKKDFTIEMGKEESVTIDKLQKGIGPVGPITIVATIDSDIIDEQQVKKEGFVIGPFIFFKSEK